MISLGWVLATTLFLSPALLGPPMTEDRRRSIVSGD